MQQKLFRKVALDRLSSPEHLDQLMEVAAPRSWQFVAAIGILLVAIGVWGIFGTITTSQQAAGILVQRNIVYLMAPASGVLSSLDVKVGDAVSIAQAVGHMTAADRGTDLAVISSFEGHINALQAHKGDYVSAGEPLLAIDIGVNGQSSRLEAVLYVPLDKSAALLPGMEAQILPAGVQAQAYGSLRGVVESIRPFPVTGQDILALTGNTVLAQKLQTSNDLVEVHVSLNENLQKPGGYSWSLNQDPGIVLAPGTLCSGTIILSRQAPISLMFLRPTPPVTGPAPATTPTIGQMIAPTAAPALPTAAPTAVATQPS